MRGAFRSGSSRSIGSVSKTSIPAPHSLPSSRALASAAVSTTAPRDVFTITVSGRMSRNEPFVYEMPGLFR